MKFSPYSFSKQSTFEQCPAKFKFQYIDKIKTEFKMNDILEKGSFIHLILEEFAKNNGVFPDNIEYNFRHSSEEQIQEYKEIANNFIFSEIGYNYLNNELGKFFGAEVEFGVKIDDSGKWVSTNYYDKKVLFRGKIDHANKYDNIMELLDWKTGKINESPQVLQLIMYAVWCFLKFPEVDEVHTAFVYIEHSSEKRYTFKRKMLKALQATIARKLIEIELEEKFEKHEDGLCQFCQFRLAGVCEETSNDEFITDMMKYSYNYSNKEY